MRKGYFINKDGYPARPNFGTSNKIVSISTMNHNVPLKDINISCDNDLIEEMRLEGYKFIDMSVVILNHNHQEIIKTLTSEQHLDLIKNS